MEKTQSIHDRNHAELRRIGLDLKALRVSAGLTQEQLIALSNGEIKQGTLSAIERGNYNVGVRPLMVYAALLGYEIRFVKRQS